MNTHFIQQWKKLQKAATILPPTLLTKAVQDSDKMEGNAYDR